MKRVLSIVLTVCLISLFSSVAQAKNELKDTIEQQLLRSYATALFSYPNDPAAYNKRLAEQYRSTLFSRFLKYVTYNSQSSYTEEITDDQKATANKLHEEIVAMGYKDALLTDHFYIFVRIPSNLPAGQTAPILGFSGHYDVTPDVTTNNVNARVIQNYQGGKVEIGVNPQGQQEVLDPSTTRDAYLNQLIGETIVTSDGRTNLGADNRAGLSILMTTLQVLADHPEKQHGEIQIIIAPNEETGGSADYIDQTPYRPEIAFDFDGSVDGELMISNFYALEIVCRVQGQEGHQSNADGSYVNHGLPACELVSQVYNHPKANQFLQKSSILNTMPQQCTQADDLILTNHQWVRLPTESRGNDGYLDIFTKPDPEQVATTRISFRARSFNENDLTTILSWVQDRAVEVVRKHTYPTYKKDVKLDYDVETSTWWVRGYVDANQKKELKIAISTNVTYSNVGTTAHPASLQVARDAFAAAGVSVRPVTERAGTTSGTFVPKGIVGAFMLFTGQNNMHSYAEWLSEKDMYESFLVGLNIIDQVALLEAEQK